MKKNLTKNSTLKNQNNLNTRSKIPTFYYFILGIFLIFIVGVLIINSISFNSEETLSSQETPKKVVKTETQQPQSNYRDDMNVTMDPISGTIYDLLLNHSFLLTILISLPAIMIFFKVIRRVFD